MIKAFLFLPFILRVVVFLAVILVIWRFLGKGILWILSLIPFLLDRLFILLYQIIEIPIVSLHKKVGGGFHKIDNVMSGFGGKVDEILNNWYHAWHSQYRFHWGKAVTICLCCLVIIVLPSFVSWENNAFRAGETLYYSFENFLEGLVEKHDANNHDQEIQASSSNQEESASEEPRNFAIELVVSGVNSSLLVRETPDIENGIVLERLNNGAKVVWTGELTFAKVEKDNIETWVKIITENGMEGWSRLYYLQPDNDGEIELFVNYMP